MKNIKKSIAISAALLVLLTVMPVTAFAAEITVSTFAELQTAITSAASGDTIIVSDNITFSGAIAIPSGKDVTVTSSNGSNFTLMATDSRHFIVSNGAVLTLANITLDGGKTGGGIDNYGAFIIFGGKICGNSASWGGGIYNSRGTVTVNSGEISGNSAVWTGGGIYNDSGAVYINNSEISNNAATYGSGIYNGSILKISGSSIRNNPAIISGGGIENSGTATINDSEISGNTATGREDGTGGAIDNYGSLSINGSRIIGNSSSRHGGGIENCAALDISNSEISGNSASGGGGGGISNWTSSGIVSIIGGKISGNLAQNGGGIYNNDNMNNSGTATVTISGCEISGNSATRNGGGIYSTGNKGDAMVAVSGGKISGNSADNGGGIYSSSGGGTATVTICDNIFSENMARGDGGGIYNVNDSGGSATITVSGGEISGNTATRNGGGVYTYDLTKATVSNTVFSANTASRAYWITSAADISTYNAQIMGVTQFSVPPAGNKSFEYAYNNYDIGYTKGLTENPEDTLYTVTFADWDGTVLDTQIVARGSGAVAPPAHARTGYTFTGWDKDFSNITGGLTVTAMYVKNDEPKPEWVVTDKKDANGVKIPSNAHSYDAGAGVVFY